MISSSCCCAVLSPSTISPSPSLAVISASVATPVLSALSALCSFNNSAAALASSFAANAAASSASFSRCAATAAIRFAIIILSCSAVAPITPSRSKRTICTLSPISSGVRSLFDGLARSESITTSSSSSPNSSANSRASLILFSASRSRSSINDGCSYSYSCIKYSTSRLANTFMISSLNDWSLASPSMNVTLRSAPNRSSIFSYLYVGSAAI